MFIKMWEHELKKTFWICSLTRNQKIGKEGVKTRTLHHENIRAFWVFLVFFGFILCILKW